MVCDDGGVFSGSHYWFWKAKVTRAGQDVLDLLHDSKKGLRGLKAVRYGWVRDREAGPILLERFRPERRSKGPGTLNIRYDLRAEQGETAFAHRRRAARVVARVLANLQKRGMAFTDPLECSKAHYARLNDPDANDAARLKMRVTTTDCFGSQIDLDASHGPEWEVKGDNAPKSMAARGRMASNVELLVEQVHEVRKDIQALWEVQANQAKLLEAQTGALVDLKQALERLPGAVVATLKQAAGPREPPAPPRPPVPPPDEGDPMWG